MTLREAHSPSAMTPSRPAQSNQVSSSQDAPSPTPADGWVTRGVDALGWVVVAIQLNVLWLLGATAGLVILGAAPASVAAATVARRQLRGELPTVWSTFWATWRSSFVSANLAHLPNVAVLGIATANWWWFTHTTLAWLAWSVGLVVIALLALATLWVAPLMAHYDLPVWRYSITSLRLVLLRPLPSVVLLLVAAAIAYVSWRWTILIALVSVGALLYAATWLGVRTFDDNEDRLSSPHHYEPITPVLPTQPLRML